jgi:hypothetical protein
MKHVLALTVLGLFLSLTGHVAQAQSGTNSGIYASSGTATPMQIGDAITLVKLDENGVFIEDNSGAFHNTSWHCWGTAVFNMGKGKSSGYCSGIDPTGDQVYLSFESKEYAIDAKTVDGTYKCGGGSGKYKGAVCEGTYHGFGGSLHPLTAGAYVNYSRNKGTHQFAQ